MPVARVTEITSTSTQGFEDAIRQGIARATSTLRNVTSAWIKEQQVRIDNGNIAEYQVNMLMTVVLEDTTGDQPERRVTPRRTTRCAAAPTCQAGGVLLTGWGCVPARGWLSPRSAVPLAGYLRSCSAGPSWSSQPSSRVTCTTTRAGIGYYVRQCIVGIARRLVGAGVHPWPQVPVNIE